MRLKIIIVIAIVVVSFFILNSYEVGQITITTDKSSYQTGDLIDLTGNVSGASNQLIAIEVKDDGGNTILIRTIQTDSNGNFELKFKVPESAKPGSFDIIANAQVGGSTLTGGKTVSANAQSSAANNTPTQTSSPFGGRCLIATAAFGSEISPQVQFLREFRDNHILQTRDGSSFMTVFNAWYYSFSPYVADYERSHPWLQITVRSSLYPLLGILTVSERAYSLLPGEYGSLTAGIVASSLIGAVYFWPFAIPIQQLKTNQRFTYKIAIMIFSGVLAGSVLAVCISNQTMSLVMMPLLVLTSITTFATFSAKLITKIEQGLIR